MIDASGYRVSNTNLLLVELLPINNAVLPAGPNE